MTPPQQQKNRTTLIAVLSIVALVVAGGVVALVLATSGVDKQGASPPSEKADPDAGLAATRDEAIEDGTEAAETLNTLDYKTAEESLKRWESVTTGELHEEIVDAGKAYEAQVANAKTTSEGKVQSAALAELDAEEGTGRLLVAMRIEITRDGAEPTTKFTRISVTIEKTKDGWKASDVETK